MSAGPELTTNFKDGEAEIRPAGSWTASQTTTLEKLLDGTIGAVSSAQVLKLNLSDVRELDTFGAWLLEKLTRRAKEAGRSITTVGVSDRFSGLIEEIHTVNRRAGPQPKKQNPILLRLGQIGRSTVALLQELLVFLQMLGAFTAVIGRVILHPRNLRLTSLVYQLYRVGWQAIPIIVLITFLIGAIIAQQGIFHFRKFGAESYVVGFSCFAKSAS
ncbi:ABC-type transporter Mla MlaB component [Nitrobacteraceae bacterium AZCC 1564]